MQDTAAVTKDGDDDEWNETISIQTPSDNLRVRKYNFYIQYEI